jgi:hypothetical protein
MVELGFSTLAGSTADAVPGMWATGPEADEGGTKDVAR